jgi:hypothetical protein
MSASSLEGRQSASPWCCVWSGFLASPLVSHSGPSTLFSSCLSLGVFLGVFRGSLCMSGQQHGLRICCFTTCCRRVPSGRSQMKRSQKFTRHRSARPIGIVFLLLTALSLASCADAPPWLGGLPKDAPPRRGTPEYEAWMAQRAAEAARPKQGQEHPK